MGVSHSILKKHDNESAPQKNCFLDCPKEKQNKAKHAFVGLNVGRFDAHV